MFNEKFRDKLKAFDVEENLISSNDSWFLNYHTLLNYYNCGKISIEKVKELIEKYFIPSSFDINIECSMKAKQNLIDFYYNNILLKKSFIANTDEISESIKSYLKDRNHIEDKATNYESKTDCDDTMNFEDLPEYEEILDSKENLQSIREDIRAEDDIPF
ncbi:MAG: hypothetical protein K6G28_00190 [Acholeplasmatales bacterium]|nr:hypothetical protein [Acholeplasmatales bacterium]